MINTAFFGTSDKSLPILEELKTHTNLRLCVTKTDRVIGRNKEVKKTEVKRWAKKNNCEVFELEKFDSNTSDLLVAKLKEHQVTVGIVADFSFIIPSQILHTPAKGLVNIHFSQLPKYRGASPVQHTILSGDTETAVTYMIMDEKMDEGDVLKQLPYPVSDQATTLSLYEELFIFGAKHLVAILTEYVEGKLLPVKQDNKAISYCYSPTKPKSTLIAKQDAEVTWHESPDVLDRKIRAYNPWPIAWAYIEHIFLDGYRVKPSVVKATKVKIYSATLENGHLVPQIVQPENKNKMDFTSFVNGYFEKI